MFRVYKFERGRRYYVAVSGSAKSYTTSRARARVYTSRAAADADKCGNESIEEGGQC